MSTLGLFPETAMTCETIAVSAIGKGSAKSNWAEKRKER
jgi:hypothetical protein